MLTIKTTIESYRYTVSGHHIIMFIKPRFTELSNKKKKRLPSRGRGHVGTLSWFLIFRIAL